MNTHTASVKNPNPQGKGLVPILQDWAALQTGALAPKSPAAFLRDYCLSSFILSASFSFRPVVGKTYYLYVRGCDSFLSLIAPHEWSDKKAGEFLAACHLRSDMTWELRAETLTDNPSSRETLQQYVHVFMNGLAEQPSITDSLPHYVRELPYYRRLFMSALSASLKRSLPEGSDTIQRLLQDPAARALLPPP